MNKITDLKNAIKHLKKCQWIEVGFKNYTGLFDITCVSHLKDFLYDYGQNKISNITQINYL